MIKLIAPRDNYFCCTDITGAAKDIADALSSDKLKQYSEKSTLKHAIASPDRKTSMSPSRRSYEKRIGCDLKGTKYKHCVFFGVKII